MPKAFTAPSRPAAAARAAARRRARLTTRRPHGRHRAHGCRLLRSGRHGVRRIGTAVAPPAEPRGRVTLIVCDASLWNALRTVSTTSFFSPGCELHLSVRVAVNSAGAVTPVPDHR